MTSTPGAEARMTAQCLVCEEDILNFMRNDPNNPMNGVVLTTPGNTGSGLFNPGHHTVLRAYLCDLCLEAKARNRFIRIFKMEVTQTEKIWLARRDHAGDEQ